VSEANPNTSDIVIVGMPPAFAGADDALISTYEFSSDHDSRITPPNVRRLG